MVISRLDSLEPGEITAMLDLHERLSAG
ncbi:hypothetical protein CBM2592_P10022 [Cupriavidus taiwanensis]|uniref:Uncharacterized protein n=1 Tax=Cupriavidus neocaledonicus TaxID=1040979 RepID=A0ABY1VC47_9BURK|nr:hypothetical protein CBM2592_P10022 [Cupriavidus taiwanensis]SOZ40369.1 hypothetical protein CBM2605_P10022 [Cupriavidus neocaledonicus]SOY73999.1 hypothetical protein CBM2588_P10022 [Cupriavidus taiwanensis]SOY74276.1 hypothetical protein CBM2585_P10021 [Cupriavidus taiwanensis]SOY98684.1 hypothetical protein CBM2591_P10022 [Cupriavidus taiwanensis]